MVEIKIDDNVDDVDIDGEQDYYLLRGQKGKEEVWFLQVRFLEKSHKEVLEGFQFGLENIKAFASKKLCPGFWSYLQINPINFTLSFSPGRQFSIVKDAMVLHKSRLKTVELVVLPLYNPFKVFALAPWGHVDALHLDDERETGSTWW